MDTGEVHEPGDLRWAKLAGHPWWPGIVCKSPQSPKSERVTNGELQFHIHFFSHPPTRAWIRAKNIRPYHGSDAPECHLGGTFHCSKSAFRTAVKEADKAQVFTLQERIAFVKGQNEGDDSSGSDSYDELVELDKMPVDSKNPKMSAGTMSESTRRQHLRGTDNDSGSVSASTGIMRERVVVSNVGGDTHTLAVNERATAPCPSSVWNSKTNRSEEKSEKTADFSHAGKQVKRSCCLSAEDLTKPKRKKPSNKGYEMEEVISCLIPECKEQSNKGGRRHTSKKHLPHQFRTQSWKDTSLHDARMAGMRWLSDRLVKTTDLNSLLEWMHRTLANMPCLRKRANQQLSKIEMKQLTKLCRQEKWLIPKYGFILYPPNSPAVLFNWRMIVMMLQYLTPEDRKAFYELDKHVIESQEVDENDKCESDDSDCYIWEGEDEDDYEVIDLDEEDDEDEDCSDSEESLQNVAMTSEESLQNVAGTSEESLQNVAGTSEESLQNVAGTTIVSEQDELVMTQNIEPSVIKHREGDDDSGHSDSKESPQNVTEGMMTMSEQDEPIVTQGLESNSIEHEEGDDDSGHSDSKESSQNVTEGMMTMPEQDEPIVTQGLESNIEHKEDENGGHTDSIESLQNVNGMITMPEQDESSMTKGIKSNMINHQAIKVENIQVPPSLNLSESVSDKVENVRVQPFLSPITMNVKSTETVNNSSDDKATVLCAIDCLFHLDKCRDTIATLNAWSTIDDLIAHVDIGVRPGVCVKVCGGVNAFCNPATYPQHLPSHPVGFKSAIGIHPKTVEDFDEQAFRHFRVLSADIGCAAVGPVGLDHTVPPSKWARQEEVLEQVLQWCFPARPVVFHIRDGVDPHSGALYTQLLRIVKANMTPKQAIHLHCFTGSLDQVIEWCQCFPNCYFGFTSMVDDFDPCQKQALESVPENRLLIETHSPALHSRRTGFRNTPAFIGDVAAIVAKARGQTTETILASCNKNARALYKL